MNGTPAASDDKVGAFVNGECRGFAPVIINGGVAYLNLNVQGEVAGEPIEFIIWDTDQCQELVACNLSVLTSPGTDIGYPDFLEIDGCPSSNCPPSLTESGTISTGTYIADQQITADGTITSPSQVNFQAGDKITLDQGFNCEQGQR